MKGRGNEPTGSGLKSINGKIGELAVSEIKEEAYLPIGHLGVGVPTDSQSSCALFQTERYY